MIGLARHWREIPQRYRYEAARCDKCSAVYFPPRLVCSKCRGREFTKTVLPQTGKVETFTVIRVAPTGFTDEAPYAVAVVKLDDSIRVMAQVVDCEVEKLAIGDRVRLEFRKVQQDGEAGAICYGYKFVPEA
ncbi:MAG: Zn-ribbon domain-containing OB-fold protein [Myxococcales bacterium]|nr:Zn-ribbon domain-containing OB-fold protein [Myxococcales bacterium]